MNKFRERLKEERLALGLTQKQIAEQLGISHKTYCNYEQKSSHRRYPDLDLLIKIANVLDVSIDYLVGRTDKYS